MLICIEGVDGTGKTELAKRLRLRLGLERTRILHAGRPTKHPLDEYELPLRDYRPASGEHLILDRWHLGEWVWPTIFGRPTQLDMAVGQHIELFMKSRGVHYVWAWREEWEIQKTFSQQGRDAQPLETRRRLAEALELFESAFATTGASFSQWNFDIDCSEQLVEEIIGRAAENELMACIPFKVTSQWCGSPSPEVLYVGMEFGPKSGASTAEVPFVPHPATSGHYLMRCLPALTWRRSALINAYVGRSRQPQDLVRFTELLGSPTAVALGNEAAKQLNLQGIAHGFAPHPQYWRRFHHHDVLGYTELLENAARKEVTPWR